jgi:hypothetical protein
VNDVEQRLRDILAEDGSHAPLIWQMPVGVRPRVRRRQAANTAVAALTTLAVIIGSVLLIRSLEPVNRPVPVTPTNTRPVFERTATIGGLTTTSPSDWYLVDYWEGGPDSSSMLDGQAIPLLELTNFDAGLSTPVCDVGPGERMRLPADGVAIFVSVGNDGWNADDLCGGSVDASATGTIGSHLYRSALTLGPDVTEEDRAAAQEIWRSMEWGALTIGYHRAHPHAYVLDGWEEGSPTWLLEARPSKRNVELSITSIQGSSGSSAADFSVPRPNAIEGEAFGAVTEDAARVEYHRAGVRTPIVARLIDLPPSLGASFDAYVVEPLPTGGPSEVVAIGADGDVLGSNLPPLVHTKRAGSVRAFGTTWNVEASWDASGYYQAACVEPAATGSAPDPCERGFGGGVQVQTFGGPSPAVFVSQVVGDPVEAIDVVSDDGTVFHAVMLPVPLPQGGGRVAVVALEGGGRGRFVYHLTDGMTDQGRRPEARVEWPDLGQVTGHGSFPPPDEA